MPTNVGRLKFALAVDLLPPKQRGALYRLVGCTRFAACRWRSGDTSPSAEARLRIEGAGVGIAVEDWSTPLALE